MAARQPRLRKSYRVASPMVPEQGEIPEWVDLPTGTPMAKIPVDQLAQLAPAHFDQDVEDWRGEEARAADAAQLAIQQGFLDADDPTAWHAEQARLAEEVARG